MPVPDRDPLAGLAPRGVRAVADGAKRHKKFADEGTWDRILAHLMAEADAAGQIN